MASASSGSPIKTTGSVDDRLIRRSSSSNVTMQQQEQNTGRHRSKEDILREKLEQYLAEKKKKKDELPPTRSHPVKKTQHERSTPQPGKSQQRVLQMVSNKPLPIRCKKDTQKYTQESDSEYMRKKLESWRLDKQKEKDSSKKTKRPPWKGGGLATPCKVAPGSALKTTSSASKESVTHAKIDKMTPKPKKSLFQSHGRSEASKGLVDVNSNCEEGVGWMEKGNVTQLATTLQEDVPVHSTSEALVSNQESTTSTASIGSVWANAHKAKRPRKHAVRFNTSPVRRSPRSQRLSQAARPATSTDFSSGSSMDYSNKELSMRQRLELWLAAKGKTPSKLSSVVPVSKKPDNSVQKKAKSRRSMPAIYNDPMETRESTTVVYSKEAEDIDMYDANPGKSKVTMVLEDMLGDCLTLLDNDCHIDTMKQWLSNICGKNPHALQCAKYWICKAKIAAMESNNQEDIIECYELAVQHGAEPIEEIRTALMDFVGAPINWQVEKENQPEVADPSSISAQPDVMATTESSSAVRCEESDIGRIETQTPSSCNVRYCVSRTPLFNRIHKVFGEKSSVTPISIVTPVRRSVRLEHLSATKSQAPPTRDVCVSSLTELPLEEMDGFIYKPNKTLQGEFDALMEVDETSEN